jgi:ABC-type methionine transport system ATPase subunit
LENVELPMTLAGKSGKRKRAQAQGLLETVGLGGRMDHHLSELSGGEQQRVAIAVSLANKPKLLLADEPTGEVDEATSLSIYETIKRLNRDLDLTVLIVSHDPGIAHHVDRVVAIRDGKTAAETVKQSRSNNKTKTTGQPGLEELEETEEVFFEELTVLDSAGRLQIPKEFMEQLNIRGRVRLEVSDEGILILPVEHIDNGLSAEEAATELEEARKQSGFRGFITRKWREIIEKDDAESVR